MSPDQQAARDAALEAMRPAENYADASALTTEQLWEMSRASRAPEAAAQWAIAAVLSGRTTPPAAAPEITQEQARELYATLKWFIDDLSAPHSRMSDFDANVARARAALAGVPRE